MNNLLYKDPLIELAKSTASFNVLYAEDEKEIGDYIYKTFSLIFNTVSLAINGEDALNKYNEYYKKNLTYYDIVITDIEMPKLDGTLLIEKIKKINKDQEFIVISAHNQSKYLMKLIKNNIRYFILKPLEIYDFYTPLIEISQKIKYKKQEIEHLIEKNKQAMIGELMDIIAHQWINQLATLKINLNFIDEEKNEPKNFTKNIKHFIEIQKKSYKNLDNTLNTLRDFYKVKNKIELISFNKIIDDAIFLIKGNLLKESINVIYECTKEKVKINKNEFIQVILNLIQNSIDEYLSKNISKENRIISIKSYIDGDTFIITYKDKAGGIPAEIIDIIFEPNVSLKKSGSGMGTYLSKLIVEKHNGKISVYNNIGGANFIIKLPL